VTGSAAATVAAFLASWGRNKEQLRDAFRTYFTPATVWENVGMATTTGIEEAFALMDGFEALTGVATYAVDTLNLAEHGDMVLTERIDHFIAADGHELSSMRLMGVFEVADGRIRAWRDYFDSAANSALLPQPGEANKRLCKEFLAAVSELRVADAIDLLTDDIVWWVPGNIAVSGFHRGKPAVEALFEPLKTVLIDGLGIELGALTAEDDRVAVEMRSSALLSNGRKYENTYHYLFTIRDGRIASAKEYLDTQHVVETLLS
jgi:limonene-1,2-epoxide hydrolase